MKVSIIGVPMDLGAGRRGVDMGPSAIRISGLHDQLESLGIEVEDWGDLRIKIPEELDPTGPVRYLTEISAGCEQLARSVRQALEGAWTPLILGGDHSVAAGSVAGTSGYYRTLNQQIGLLWIDAHTDIHTPETTESGNVHGMPLAAVLGMGPAELVELEGFKPKVAPEQTFLIGARSVDPAEKEVLKSLGIRVVTMSELDKRGMKSAMEEALQVVRAGTAGFHCSFDLDVVDPRVAPGVGTPVQGGMTYRESHLAMEMVADSQGLRSLEIVELNPVLDQQNMTGCLAVELISSALGKKIL